MNEVDYKPAEQGSTAEDFVKNKFSTPYTSMGNFSGWSEENCQTCDRPVTNAAKKYSKEKFGVFLCRFCQRIHRVANE